jgi:hypothetical protein
MKGENLKKKNTLCDGFEVIEAVSMKNTILETKGGTAWWKTGV